MGSRIPDVIAALVALARTDPELKGVAVADGPEVSESQELEWLIPGWDGDPNGDFQAAQSSTAWSDLGPGREEEFQVTVAVIVNRGDTDVPAARARAYEIFGRVEAWLRADPGLGLRSLEAGIGGTQLVQDQTDNGAQVRLALSIAGRGFMT
jgi:hypothetical protein